MNITKKEFTPVDVIELLSAQIPDRRPAVKAIAANATISSLLSALEAATDAHVRQILCDVLGNRVDASAVPSLVTILRDPDPGVRAAAADALAKIGSLEAGPFLYRRFESEPASEVRQMLALALGSVGYREAIPLLIAALNDPSEVLRGCAAWSLGHLKARNAEGPLRKALTTEKDAYAANRIKAALEEIVGT